MLVARKKLTLRLCPVLLLLSRSGVVFPEIFNLAKPRLYTNSSQSKNRHENVLLKSSFKWSAIKIGDPLFGNI